MPDIPLLDDGLLHFTVRNRETGEDTKQALDILLLRLTCEECETQNNLQTNEAGAYIVTAAFLADLAGRIDRLGVPGCTASMAYQLWCASAREIEALKKNMNETPNLPTGSESNPEPSPSDSVSDSGST